MSRQRRGGRQMARIARRGERSASLPVRCMLSVAQTWAKEMPHKIPGTSARLDSFLQTGNGGAAVRKAQKSQVKKAGEPHGDANAKTLAHRPGGSDGSGDDILRVPCIYNGLLDLAGMAVYRRGTADLWCALGFGWADNVRGRLMGPADTRTTFHAPVVGRRSLDRGGRHAGGGGAHSRHPLFGAKLTARQTSLRRRCDAGWLVGDGPRS